MHIANNLDKKGLVKEANYLDALLKRAGFVLTDQHGTPIDPAQQAKDRLDPSEIMALQDWVKENLSLSEQEWREKLRLLNAGNVEAELGPEAKQLLDGMRGIGPSESEGEAGVPESFKNSWENLSEAEKASFADWLLEGGPADASSKTSAEAINDLIKLSNHLDGKGLIREADYLDALIRTK